MKALGDSSVFDTSHGHAATVCGTVKPLCIYHGNCADGFGAAWAVRHALGEGNVDFHPGVYQDAPPDVTGRDVIIVDFSYKRAVLDGMIKTANSIVILDHHKSAADDLAPFAITLCGAAKFVAADVPGVFRDMEELGRPKIVAEFDMNRSGAMMTWDHFFPREAPPALLLHIEDRDLWRFKLPRTREIQANVFSYPYDFAVWDRLMAAPLDDLAREGEAIERKHFKDIAELLTVVRREMVIGGYCVPVANLPYTLTSDAGHFLCEYYDQGLAGSYKPPFAACYWDTPSGRVFSLRSRDDGLDVSAVAKKYGGGGHAHAAGFRVAIGWEGDK